ncbi:hypothetical protein TNIN_90541 [Trichonephila inaurata madagascariensis]|uniref:Uncharacterized protein n=1 Tax=Trichonephila inaurata madagascariensis TaxID=2747483 RepID=A0A8X6YQQ1_9ARAC|nr:hypothetical protein TNIN_90541 [Trichonephila inaurata madagascariensis]
MSAPRTDVASSIKVGDLFSNEPLSFDANVATAHLDKCTTCVECEDVCDILEEILNTLNDPDITSTPERLRLINLIQWTALKCSRKSIRLQNQEFREYIKVIERLNRVPTAPAAEEEKSQAPVCIASDGHSVEKAGTLDMYITRGPSLCSYFIK